MSGSFTGIPFSNHSDPYNYQTVDLFRRQTELGDLAPGPLAEQSPGYGE